MDRLYIVKTVITYLCVVIGFLCSVDAFGANFGIDNKKLKQINLYPKECKERIIEIADNVNSVSFSYDDNGNLINIGCYNEKNHPFEANFDYKNGELNSISTNEIYPEEYITYNRLYDSNGYLLLDDMSGSIPEQPLFWSTYSYDYDSLGNLSLESYKTEENMHISGYEYKYQQGRIISSLRYITGPFDNYSITNEYTYTSNGRIESRTVINSLEWPGELQSKDIYSYEKEGLSGTIDHYQNYAGDLTLSGRSEILFDSHGHLIQETYYTYSWGEWTKSWTKEYFCPGVNIYDSNNRVLLEITNGRNASFFGDDEKKYQKDQYVYDENGNVIEYSIYLFNDLTGDYSLIEKTVMNFDSSNRLLKEVWLGSNHTETKREYRYDSDDNLIYSLEDGIETFYTYENGVLVNTTSQGWTKYYENGNVIKEELYSNGEMLKRRVFTHDFNVLNSNIQGVVMNGEHKNKILFVTVYEALGSYTETYTYSNIEVVDPDPVVVTLKDAVEYMYNEDTYVSKLIYSRDFDNTDWQALYIPFSLSVDTLKEYGLVLAELNKMHMYDRDNDGEFEEINLEFLRMTKGETEPNCPYLIKATSVGERVIELNDVELKAAEEASVSCATIKQTFTFTGTYTGLSNGEMYANNYYALGGGNLSRSSSASVSLKPQRWYMSIANKNGTPVAYYAPSFRIYVSGWEEEENVTGVSAIESQASAECLVYSMDGRKVQGGSFLRPGIYVSNGRKFIIR